MTDILAEIAAYKREFVAHRRYAKPLSDVRRAARDAEATADFCGCLQQEGISLIAEVKKASPSRGLLRADFDPEELATTYVEHGARALSVLTDEAYFQGSDEHLRCVRRLVPVPVLRKDFIVDPYQIYETRTLGADALLIIVDLMDGEQLDDFLGLSRELGLAALTEVHDAAGLARAQAAGARLIGINNRDLRTFQTNLDTTLELRDSVSEDATLVSESGIRRRQDVEQLEAVGVDAILVGEALVREQDIGAKIDELLGQQGGS